jgi:hypothetical protein
MATLLELPFCNKDPGKKLGFAMWPLGRPAGAGGSIPASAGGGTRRERRGGGLGIARVRFGVLVVAWRRPTRVLGGARRWPPRAALRRGCCSPERAEAWQGRGGRATRAQREDRPPFKQPSRTGRQRTDRWSPGCGRPRYGGGTSRRIGTRVAWGKREPRNGTQTAGRRPALARAYGGAPRGAARGVALWSARARPAPTRAEPIRSSLF